MITLSIIILFITSFVFARSVWSVQSVWSFMRSLCIMGLGCFLTVPSWVTASAAKPINLARSKAMGGAHRGLGTSNDTVFLNPAGMLLTRRYSVDMGYRYSSKVTTVEGADSAKGSEGSGSQYSIIAVDSKSSPLAVGVGVVRDMADSGDLSNRSERYVVATAYPLSPAMVVGITLQRLSGLVDGVELKEREWGADVGLAVRGGSGFSLGVTYHNSKIWAAGKNAKKRWVPGFGGGLGFTYGPLSLATDIYIDLESKRNDYHAGAEYFIAGSTALRMGISQLAVIDEYTGKHGHDLNLSAGVGVVNQGGALEATYNKVLKGEMGWEIIGAAKFFL